MPWVASGGSSDDEAGRDGEAMTTITRFLVTSIGQKILMGLTGLLLILFLIVHLGGNLLIFSGPDAYNAYSEKLITSPLIYAAEAGLLVLFAAHFMTSFVVTRRNLAARPTPYYRRRWVRRTSHKSLASTTMLLSGLVVLAFVPLHLYTFKFGPHYPSAADPRVRDLYRLVIEVFADPRYVAWYAFAMSVIGLHLWHGVGSAFQSLGVTNRGVLYRGGQLLATILAGGFLTIPVALFLMRRGS